MLAVMLAATNGPQQQGTVSRSLAYSNPGKVGKVAWHFKLSPTAPCPCHAYAKLVAKRHDETAIYLADLAAGASLQFAPSVYDPEQVYRLYYLVYNNNNGRLYKSHGDLRFTP